MGKSSGAAKRKKKREKEELALEMERLKLGPTKLWTGLVVHHKDVFVSHVFRIEYGTDLFFFSTVNRESFDVLEYAGVDVSKVAPGSRMHIRFDVGMGVESRALGKERYRRKSDGSSLVLQASCCNEQTRVSQVDTREVKKCNG